MDWSNEITAGFPPQNDAEPPTLRERIVAEISDHLDCAYQRERLKAVDEASAIKAVLQKFGNPATLARNLWIEEMKGQIMMQRTTIGLLIAMVVGFCFFLYQNHQNQQAFLQQNAAMLLAIQNSNPQPPAEKWDPVVMKLKGTSPDPAKPLIFDVTLSKGKDFSVTKKVQLGSEVDYGPLAFGEYKWRVRAPWRDSYEEEFVGGPRRDQHFEVNCPTKQLPIVEMKLKIDEEFEDHLKKNQLSLLVLSQFRRNDQFETINVQNDIWKNASYSFSANEFVFGHSRHKDGIERRSLKIPIGCDFYVLYVGIVDSSGRAMSNYKDPLKKRQNLGYGEIESEFYKSRFDHSTIRHRVGYASYIPRDFPVNVSNNVPPTSLLEIGQHVLVREANESIELKIQFPERFLLAVDRYLAEKRQRAIGPTKSSVTIKQTYPVPHSYTLPPGAKPVTVIDEGVKPIAKPPAK